MEFSHIRRREKEAIAECLQNCSIFRGLPRVAKKLLVEWLENSCNNATFDTAVMRKLPQIWNDPRYLEIYSNIGFNLKINLDPNSSINVDQNDEIKYHVSNMVISYMIKKYCTVIGNIWDSDVPWEKIMQYIPSIDPREIAYLNGHEINPTRSQKYLDEIELREKQKINRKFTTQFACPQCNVRRATFKSVQSRGLDEDNTLYILCDNCGHTWKKN